MTRQETYQVMALLQATYPDSFRGMSDAAAQVKVNLWAELFADEPAAVVSAAVKAYVATDTRGFMPVPGQIKERIALMDGENSMTAQEAWNKVLDATKNSTYGCQEEFQKLPPRIQRVVGSAVRLKDWAMCDARELRAIGSGFQKSYQELTARAKDTQKIPAAVRKALADGTEKKLLSDGHES